MKQRIEVTDGKLQAADGQLAGTPSVVFDAVALVLSEAGCAELLKESAAMEFAAHAFAHIVYKELLLMAAGSVLFMTGKRNCTDVGGLFRSMPITTICGIGS